MRLRIPLTEWGISLCRDEKGIYASITKNKDIVVMGWRSCTKDSMHVIFIDYDYFNLKRLKEEVKRIQNKHFLGNAYFFETSPEHYHVVFLDKVSYVEYLKILENTTCDPQFLASRYKTIKGFREGVLRFTRKGNKAEPKLIYILKSSYSTGWLEKSRAHYLAFKMWYGIPKIPETELDRYTEMPFPVMYKTR